MYIDEKSYTKNQALQYKDASAFLNEELSSIEWGKEDGVVMDLGCGPGLTTTELILPFFPNSSKLVAVDLLPNMINFAKQNYSHQKIEYEVANIEDRNTIKRFDGEISKLVSIHCIPWLENQKLGFQNIHHVLKPGGEAAFIFTSSSHFWNSIMKTVEDRKWSAYLKDVNHHIPETQGRRDNSSHYKKMLEDIGFTVILCEESERICTFQSDEECREFSASICVGLSSIPVEHKEEFKDHLLQNYLLINGRSEDGLPQHTGRIFKLIIRKEK